MLSVHLSVNTIDQLFLDASSQYCNIMLVYWSYNWVELV